MSETKKINMSAMTGKTNNSTEKNLSQENISEENSQKSSGIKINLSSIKSQIKEKPVVKVPEVKQEPKDERALYMESLTSKMTDAEEVSPAKKISISSLASKTQKTNTPENIEKEQKEIKKLQISSLKKPIQTEVKQEEVSENNQHQEKKEKISELTKPLLSCDIAQKEEFLLEKLAHDNKNPQANPNEVFHNYESEFKKKQGHILESIDKIKEITNIKKLSKTNKIFITSIIGLTVIAFGFLFYVNPDSHSLDNYKASILTLAGKQMTTQEVKEHQGNIQEEIAWKLEENNLGGYNLGFEILVNEQGNAVYKFDGEEYETKELLDVAIYGKLEELKKDRIRDYFKNNSPAEESSSEITPIENNGEETSQENQEEVPEETSTENMQAESESPEEVQNTSENEEIIMQEENLSEEEAETPQNSENTSMDILMKNYSQGGDTAQENNSEDESVNENTPAEENAEDEEIKQQETPQQETQQNEEFQQEENIQDEEIQQDNNDENYYDEMEMYEEFMFEEF